MKRCTKCKEHKDRAEFPGNRSKSDGLGTECRICCRAKVAEWRQRPGNADRARKKSQDWFRSNPEQHAATNRTGALRRNFNISTEQYDEMLAAQGGGCAICRQPPTERRLAVDHDHACCPGRGRSCGLCIRGLLCTACNTRLGWLEDTTWRAQADQYLMSQWT